MKKLCKLFSLLLALALLVSCAPKGADGTLCFTDSTGYELRLPAKPQRAAVLFSSLADVWRLAGGEIAVTVGEAIERGFASADTPLADDGAGKTINIEVLVAAAPDLVILSADIPEQVKAATLLRDMGIPAALFRMECFEEYLSVLKIFTTLCENPEAFRRYGTAQQAQINTLLAKQPLSGERILFIRAGTSARSVKAKRSSDHFAAAMLCELGAINIADTAPILVDGLAMEVILQEDPDRIVFIAMGDEAASVAYVTQMLSDPTWQSLTAVREGRYGYLSKELFHYKPCARWAEAYGVLAEICAQNNDPL